MRWRFRAPLRRRRGPRLCINGGATKGRGRRVLRSLSCSTERGAGRGRMVVRTFWAPPIPRLRRGGVARTRRKGEGAGRPCSVHVGHWGAPTGGAERWGHEQEGREHANCVCMLPPFFTPPVRMPRCTQRGRAPTVGGRGRGAGAGREGKGRAPRALLTRYLLLFSVVFIKLYERLKQLEKVEFKFEWRENGCGGPDREISAKSQRLALAFEARVTRSAMVGFNPGGNVV